MLLRSGKFIKMSNKNSGNIEEGESEVISNQDIDTMSVLDDPRVTAEEE